MLIKKIKLHPFAGVSDLEISLDKGMNVIHGPNEAGKSTIVRAIEFAFFAPPKLMKKGTDMLKELFLPRTGGDTVSVTIDFSIGENEYTLKRTWGGTESAKLSGTDIGKITNSENVVAKLSELLILNQASWKNILFSHQSKLSHTFQNIVDESDIKNSLSDILRGSVISSGGISIESMKNTLEEKIEEYFKYWDDSLNRPKDGKGLEDRWKYPGKIADSYYAFEQAKLDLKSCLEYDEKMDACIKQITAVTAQITETKKYLDENAPIVKDAETRKLLVEKEKVKQLQRDNLNNDAKEWNTYRGALPEKEKTLKAFEKEPEALGAELAIAQKKEGVQGKKDKLKKATAIIEKNKKLREDLKKKKKVNEDDMTRYDELKTELRELNATLKAQKLIFDIKAKTGIDGTLQKGIGEKKKIKLKKGQTISDEASGKIYLETDELILSVESGAENISSIARKIENKQGEIEKLNKKYGIESYKELEELQDESAVIISEMDKLDANLETVLDGEKIEKLKKEIQEIEDIPSVRSSKKINEEIIEKTKNIEIIGNEISGMKNAVAKLERQYRSFDELSEKQLEAKAELNEIKKKLSSLKPLPAGKNVDALITEYNSKSTSHEKLNRDSTGLLVTKAGLREPPFTSEDVKGVLTSLKNDFELNNKEGQAYKKISETLNTILASESGDVFKPFSEKLRTYFSILTAGKYSEMVVQEVLPTTIKNDKVTLPIHILSKGTTDALALAQKLSMAEYYLRNSSGFLVLDDPLRDLDPGRESSAVKVLCEFAKEKQLIILTCDPVHAKMFGVKEINL